MEESSDSEMTRTHGGMKMKFAKTTYSVLIIIMFLAILSGCGGGGDSLGSDNGIIPDIPGTSDVSQVLANAKSYLALGTTSAISTALSLFQELENNPNYSPTANEKLQARTGLKYCEIRLGTSPINNQATSAYLENLINNASGAQIPEDTYFLLSASYLNQNREPDSLTIMETLFKNGSTVVNPNFSYDSELGIASAGDAHAVMALLYLMNGQALKATEQKSYAASKGTTNKFSEYIPGLESLGL